MVSRRNETGRMWVFALMIGVLTAGALGQSVLINEVDADTPSTDTAEFVELYGTPNQSLDGYVLVFFNGFSDGTGDVSYAAYDLDAYSLSAEGFFVICCNSGEVANCDYQAFSSGTLQNGADAVALYIGNGTDFPNGTTATATNLVDALVYDTNDSNALTLLSVLTPGQAQINEDGAGSKDTHSNSRFPDGGTPLVTSTYTQQLATPGVTNGGGPASGPIINEFVGNHTGEDFYEFVEVFGEADTDYSNLTIVYLAGASAEVPGTILSTFTVGTTDGNGYWWTDFLHEEFSNTTKTYLLVDGFSGSVGQLLDTDSDGSLDIEPWTEIVDDVAVSYENLGDQVYSDVVLLDGFDGAVFPPAGASRIPNGVDSDTINDWKRNAFNGLGLPDFSGGLEDTEALNTPGYENTQEPLAIAVINEFVADHVGTDDHEFIEILGDPNTDYSDFTLLQVDGDATANPGQILSAHGMGTTNGGGYATTGLLSDVLANASITLLLVKDFTGSVSDDLDTDDDGTMDATPWNLLMDSVAVDDGQVGDVFFSGSVLDASFDGGSVTPGGASRIPNGTDTNQNTDWTRNDFDGDGLLGSTVTLDEGEALNTPAAYNVTQYPGGNDAVINEFNTSHNGYDDYEYYEVFGSPDTNYTHLWIVQIRGDTYSGGNPGTILHFAQVGQTDANGLWVSPFYADLLFNYTHTLVLVSNFTGILNQDLDTNDDGVLDITPWDALIDDVAVLDNTVPPEPVYSAAVLAPGYDGNTFSPGGASRIPNGVDTDTSGDWKRNNFYELGLPNGSGPLADYEALNTPGAINSDDPPAASDAMLSEFVVDHQGTDTNEYLEIFGAPWRSYGTTYLLVIDGDDAGSGGDPGHVDAVFQCGVTDSDGFWATDYQNEALDNGSFTIMLVEDFTGTQGDDLDVDDDGTLDDTPWSGLSDDVAVDDGGVDDRLYTTVILTDALDRAGYVGGASRIPYGVDTDSASDWMRNDFDGQGLVGFMGSLESGEAYNTPDRVNRMNPMDYYAGVSWGSVSAMRASLHEIIKDHVRFPYTVVDPYADSWTVLEIADQHPDPSQSDSILDVYKNGTYDKFGGGVGPYNREHTWPKSFGFPDDGDDNYPYTDMHHLMLCDSTYNSNRNNKAYGTCNGGCSEDPTDYDAYLGTGGPSATYPGNSNWYQGSAGTGTYEVWYGRRGDVARNLLYLDLRYEGGFHGVTGFAEPDLILTDDTGLINTTGVNADVGYMGRLSVLLQWHEEDPVDAVELARNEAISSFQGNRNPFVDHPEFVDCVFWGECSPFSACPELFDVWSDGTTSACTSLSDHTVLDFIRYMDQSCGCPQ